MGANGMALDRDGKPSPNYQGVDLRDRMQVVNMECELAEEPMASCCSPPNFWRCRLRIPDNGERRPVILTLERPSGQGLPAVHLTG